VYGIIHDMHIDDDGLVRQLVTAEAVDEAIIADNRVNRNVPVEISVLFVGYRGGGRSATCCRRARRSAWMPYYLCDARRRCASSPARVASATSGISCGRRPAGGRTVSGALQPGAGRTTAEAGRPGMVQAATQELITLLRDDYPNLDDRARRLSDACDLFA
jgi:cytochrome c1